MSVYQDTQATTYNMMLANRKPTVTVNCRGCGEPFEISRDIDAGSIVAHALPGCGTQFQLAWSDVRLTEISLEPPYVVE